VVVPTTLAVGTGSCSGLRESFRPEGPRQDRRDHRVPAPRTRRRCVGGWRQITSLRLEETTRRCRRRRYGGVTTERRLLARAVCQPEFGARPLRRTTPAGVDNRRSEMPLDAGCVGAAGERAPTTSRPGVSGSVDGLAGREGIRAAGQRRADATASTRLGRAGVLLSGPTEVSQASRSSRTARWLAAASSSIWFWLWPSAGAGVRPR